MSRPSPQKRARRAQRAAKEATKRADADERYRLIVARRKARNEAAKAERARLDAERALAWEADRPEREARIAAEREVRRAERAALDAAERQARADRAAAGIVDPPPRRVRGFGLLWPILLALGAGS